MNLYQAKLYRIYLGPGLMEKTVIVHAANPQTAGKKIKLKWPEWVQQGKLEIVRQSTAFDVGNTVVAS